jgi:hypothetical protein
MLQISFIDFLSSWAYQIYTIKTNLFIPVYSFLIVWQNIMGINPMYTSPYEKLCTKKN